MKYLISVVIAALLVISVMGLLLMIPAAILAWLLGILASGTGWPIAIGFWNSYIIVVLLAVFVPRG